MRYILYISLLFLGCTVAQAQSYNIKVTPVDSNIYLYTSYGDVDDYKRIDANAVIAISGDDVMLFDTPWDSLQAEQLISFVTNTLHKNIQLSIITHAHVDRIGSIDVMHQHGIPTYAYHLTAEQADRHKHTRPQHSFYNTDTTFQLGKISVTAYYPGAGHTIDNIVLYIPEKQFLYGGCFIKSGASNSIGNIADADVAEWPESVKRMEEKFNNSGIDMVIPGHGTWESDMAIKNTLRLLTQVPERGY